MSLEHILALRCVRCGAVQPRGAEGTCPACGVAGILDVEYDYALAARTLELLSRQEVARWGRDFDVLVTPTSAILPPLAGAILEAQHAAPDQPVADVIASVSFTAFGNVTGLPAISLPLQVTDAGLPVGVQLVGAPWAEATLIALSAQLEAALPWAGIAPALSETA